MVISRTVSAMDCIAKSADILSLHAKRLIQHTLIRMLMILGITSIVDSYVVTYRRGKSTDVDLGAVDL